VLSFPQGAFDHGILAAVSGGADSVAMMCMLAQSCPPEGKLAIAHVNHGIRGADSDADAEFVQTLAAAHKLRYFEHRIGPFPGRAVGYAPSVVGLTCSASSTSNRLQRATLSENTARNLRYDFLVQQAEQIGFRYLATAHTADDQTETVLHRLLRGTGLAGLAGIVPLRTMTQAVTLLRPLLTVRRSAILAYLESLEQTFREDKTNAENQFTRNRIRNELLPLLRKKFNPKMDEAVCRLATLAAEHEAVLTELLDGLLESALVERSPDRIVLNVLPLQHCSEPVLRQMLIHAWKRQRFPMREMDFSQWSALAELFQTPDKRLDFPGGISAKRIHTCFVVGKDQR